MPHALTSPVWTGLRNLVPILLLVSVTGTLAGQAPREAHPSAHRRMSAQDETALHQALDAYDQGKAKEAEPILRDLAKRYPASYEASEALGSIYAETGDPARALPFLEQASVLSPHEALAHANLGAAYLKLSRANDAVRELDKATALDPRNGLTQSNLGQALMSTRQPQLAAKAFSVAAEIAPGDVETQYNWALALYESGSARAAADVLRKLPATGMTDQMHSLAGDAEEQAGSYKEALTHFQAAAQLNPSDANLYALTGELLRHWTWAEAIEVANFGAGRYPASTHFKLAAGIGYYGKGDYTEAVRVFAGLLRAEPDNAAVADLLGRSCSLLADGENTGCEGMYDFAQRHPGNAVMTTYAAVAILHAPREKQDLDKAAVLLRSAIAAKPDYAEAYFQMGVLEQTRLLWKESAADLERAVALRPKSPEAHYRLSRAYTHLGRREEAQAEIALNRTYSQEAKDNLDAKMQEVVTFLLKPS